MKQRVLRGIAKAIVQNEKTIANKESTVEEIRAAMDAIKELTNQVTSLEDLFALDEIISDMMRE